MVSTSMQDLTPSESILNQLMEIARISALAEMASGIAHELNQPLGAIATFSQAGDRLLNRPEPLVAQALDVFRQINAAAMGAGEGIRRIRRLVDRLRIQHVLFALVQNAIDAAAQGSGVPQVKVGAHADRYAVATSVSDSGPGVSAAISEQLFRPFFTTKSQ